MDEVPAFDTKRPAVPHDVKRQFALVLDDVTVLFDSLHWELVLANWEPDEELRTELLRKVYEQVKLLKK